VYLSRMATFKDGKVKITVKYKGDKISMLIPKQADFSLITEYISRMVQVYDEMDTPAFIEDSDPGDEQNTVSNG
jgi:hypothetical protein